MISELFDQTIKVLDFEAQPIRQSAVPAMTVYFVSSQRIQKINLQTRSIDRETDVLSFPMIKMKNGRITQRLSDADYEPDEHQLLLNLGEIVLCLHRAEKQATLYQHSMEREVGFLAVHGFLHLLGFDHDSPAREKTMQKWQRLILNEYGLTR